MNQQLKGEATLVGVQFARAAGCCLVFCHHLAQRMSRSSDFGWLEPLRSFARTGAFGVAVFFVLSGFLLARPFWLAFDAGQNMPCLRVYALRRAARILPAFWVAITVSFLCSFGLFGAELDGRLVLRYLAGVFLVSDLHWLTMFPVEFNAPLWSIAFEVSSYVLLPLGALALFKLRAVIGNGWRSRALWCAVIGGAVVVHWFICSQITIGTTGSGWEYGLLGGARVWMPYFNPFSLFATFAVGALAAAIQLKWANTRHWIFDVLSVAAVATSSWLCWNLAFTRRLDGGALLLIPYGFPIFPLAVASGLAFLPQTVVVGRILDNSVMRYLATISFGIYLWHCLVLELVYRHAAGGAASGHLFEDGEFSSFATVVVALTLGSAHVSYRFLERPVRTWARAHESFIARTGQARPGEARAGLPES